jgi:hypothetical protein
LIIFIKGQSIAFIQRPHLIAASSKGCHELAEVAGPMRVPLFLPDEERVERAFAVMLAFAAVSVEILVAKQRNSDCQGAQIDIVAAEPPAICPIPPSNAGTSSRCAAIRSSES